MKVNEVMVERLKNVMLNDTNGMLDATLKVIKSDILSLLSNYMTLEKEDLALDLFINPDGTYKLVVSALTKQILSAGYMIKE